MEKLRNRICGFKVLIVEDSTLYRQLLKETLHERFPSIEIREAADGEEAFLGNNLSKQPLSIKNSSFFVVEKTGLLHFTNVYLRCFPYTIFGVMHCQA